MVIDQVQILRDLKNVRAREQAFVTKYSNVQNCMWSQFNFFYPEFQRVFALLQHPNYPNVLWNNEYLTFVRLKSIRSEHTSMRSIDFICACPWKNLCRWLLKGIKAPYSFGIQTNLHHLTSVLLQVSMLSPLWQKNGQVPRPSWLCYHPSINPWGSAKPIFFNISNTAWNISQPVSRRASKSSETSHVIPIMPRNANDKKMPDKGRYQAKLKRTLREATFISIPVPEHSLCMQSNRRRPFSTSQWANVTCPLRSFRWGMNPYRIAIRSWSSDIFTPDCHYR